MARAKLPEAEGGGKDGMFQISWLWIGVCGSSDWLRVGTMPLFHKNSPGTSRMTEHTFCAKDHGLGRAVYPTFFLSRKIMIELQVRNLNLTNKVHGCHACEIAYLFSKLYRAENP